MMSYILTNRGVRVKVDDEDKENLSKYKWSLSRGYAYTSIKADDVWRATPMHMLIMGTPKGHHTDHINGNTLDNRKGNLRICTPAENGRNRKLNYNNKSGYKGVHKVSKNRWQARIVLSGEKINLGLYKSAFQASEAYNSAAKKYFREFAKLN